jgi:hypothetical protein
MFSAPWLGLSLLSLVADAVKVVPAHCLISAWPAQDALSHQKQSRLNTASATWFALHALAMMGEKAGSVGLVEEFQIAALFVLVHRATVVGDGQFFHERMQLSLQTSIREVWGEIGQVDLHGACDFTTVSVRVVARVNMKNIAACGQLRGCLTLDDN